MKITNILSIMALTTTIIFANDVDLTKTKSDAIIKKAIEMGTYKQKLFIALNPSISNETIDKLLKMDDDIISSTLADNPKYKKYLQEKAFLRNKKQQEIINSRKTINFYVNDLEKVTNVIQKLEKEEPGELKEYYKNQLFSLIDKYKEVFYKLDNVEINRAIAKMNISVSTIDFLLSKSKHKDDFIVRKNILHNNLITMDEFIEYFKKENNHFLLHYIDNRRIAITKKPDSENLGDINKIKIENEEKTQTNVILAL